MSSSLMRMDTPDDYGLKELQNKILEIMVYIDELCQQHQIEYCLMGGSALGARRHGGFIPWDDDLDIFMTLDNYEKFRDVFLKYGDKEKYYLQELGSTGGMVTTSKIRMNGTTYIEEIVKNWDMHHGLFVDIFILHNCPDNKFLQLRQFIWAKYIILRGLCNREYNRRKGIVRFILRLMKFFPKRFLLKKALREVYRYKNVTTRYYCNFLGKAGLKNGIYERVWFDSCEYVPFETLQFKVAGKQHEYLTKRFGDYMEIPSKDRIRWEQHAWKWDINKDFREYVSGVETFKDEKYLF